MVLRTASREYRSNHIVCCYHDELTMTVKQILSGKGRDVHTLVSTATVASAVSLLTQRNIGALVVTDAGGGIAGIISERDIVRALAQMGTAVLTSPIADIMTRKVVTCAETVTIGEIMERMTQGKLRHLPVVERARLAGIVSIGDAVKARLEELENKLMNVEAVVGSIAHEVRQPLAAIAVNGGAALRFLEKTPPDHDEVREALNRMIADCHRTSEVFDSIRALFRTVDLGKQSVDVNDIILGVLQSLNGELKNHGVTTLRELSPELPHVGGHRSQLHQVISNLVRNAIEAMDATTDRDRTLRVKTELVGRDAIRILVEDSGPGIEPEQLDDIFDAFVTTKAHGMGLGLAISRTIVERHGGQLSAVSDDKTGTLFQLVLPIDSESAARPN